MAERFDWYQVSVPGVGADDFLGQFLSDHPSASFLPQKGMHGYTHGGLVRAGDFDLLRVLWGGNSDAPLNAGASGNMTMPYAEWVRDRFPLHDVTRLDACIDFESPGAWDVLLDRSIDVKRDHKLSSREQGDWLDGGVKGRTFYLGAPSSDVQFRLYEKGKKEGQGADWVRAELQVRPKKLARRVCASVAPEQVWGFSRWSRSLRVSFGASEVSRLAREVVQKQAFEHRFAAMMKQYGNTLRELEQRMGSEARFLEALRTGLLPSAEPQG